MKKKPILAGIAAIMGVSGFYGYSAATAGSVLSGRGMKNASILSDPTVTVDYAKCCAPKEGAICYHGPYLFSMDQEDCEEEDPEEEDWG